MRLFWGKSFKPFATKRTANPDDSGFFLHFSSFHLERKTETAKEKKRRKNQQ